jgi:RecJ-like exonuclease
MTEWITHEEDVWWQFEGNHPNQLRPGRYYRGTVDGYAEFGVFVDIGDHVTGLLHKSEIDGRLESLDWDEGDTVFIQVKNVRDNGNVDLGWSIRQSEAEFRGHRVHDPSAEGGERPVDETETADARSDQTPPRVRAVPRGESKEAADTETETDREDESEAEVEAEPTADTGGGEHEPESESESESEVESQVEAEVEVEDHLERATIETLDDRVGEDVTVEGVVVEARQTSGPTVFGLRDETGTVECAAFESAGVRAYPDVGVDDVVRLVGEVERRHGELQVETDELEALSGTERETVEDRLAAAIEEEARAPETDPLAADPAIDAVAERVREAATAVRRAVMDARPVVVRHAATADGYAAGAALERAVLPLVEEEHATTDAVYHLFERRPLEDGVYDMNSATGDVTDMLEAEQRHDEPLPLVVLVAAGDTRESAPAYGLLDAYGVERVVITDGHPDADIEDEVATMVNPALAGGAAGDTTATTLAATVAAGVNADVRDELAHLPALSHWTDTPEAYLDAARGAGYDADDLAAMREAVAFEAYYQSYEDKREIVADLLFGGEGDAEGASDFARHLADQFGDRLEDELETAERNLGIRAARGITFAVLDTDAYTHRFDFPPTELLLDELHRRERPDHARLVTIGLGEDKLHLRSTEALDVRAVAANATDRAENAGISAVGGYDGHIEFLVGERDAVLEAVVAAVADEMN